jgi:serine/threonine-protein kinase
VALSLTEALADAATALGLTSVVPVAQGGQKVVARATHGGQPVILKVVMLAGAADPNAFERCEREVDLLQQLNAPNVVRVLSDMVSLGTGPDAAAWLEEELDGQDLSTLLGSVWSWQVTEALLADVGAGLDAMHGNHFVHRDLSPANIRRLSTGRWKIMDPGFAKHLKRSSITGLWQPGTEGYKSPEHAGPGGRITPASDMFCLGILAYRALTGQLPIVVGADPADYGRRLRSTQAPSVRLLRPDLTDDQDNVIDTCLQVQPARRYLNAAELLARLAEISQGRGPA